MRTARKHAEPIDVPIEFNPERMARRLKGSLAPAGVKDAAGLDAVLKLDPGATGDDRPRKQAERALRRARADVAQPMVDAMKKGAGLPQVSALMKRAWKVERVDAPAGEANREAAPAWVVRFEGNSPMQRLARAGVVTDAQVRAAEKVASLWVSAVKPPRVTASYDITSTGGGGPVRPPIDVKCDAWRMLQDALNTLLPVERDVLMNVVIHEQTIEAQARAGMLVPMTKKEKAEGAIVQSLRCGLERLSAHWGLDVGVPHE